MEDAVQETAKTLDQTEKGLLTFVTLKEPTDSGLELQLAKFRDACVSLYFLDLQVALSKDVETRLWAAHGRVNSKLRSYLATLRTAKKRQVERRKAEKLYMDFIKSSIRFYRGFIQRLASNFKGIPEIFDLARGFGLDPLSINPPVTVDTEQKRSLLCSCHATLIRLGDLSRYRATELEFAKRNWGPAQGYYKLAGALMPNDGQTFNQLAVISLADNDHLRAVYNLYRALTVENSPEPARGNLELEFKKIRTRYSRNEPLLPADTASVSPELDTMFLTFHARAFQESQFDDHQEQRTAIVNKLAECLKTDALDVPAKKMCLISISAGHYTLKRAHEAAKTDSNEALRFLSILEKLQALNISTFTMLLQLLAKELEPVVAEGVGEMDEASCIARVTPVCRRILPLLRLYSSWFLSTASFLLDHSLQLPNGNPDLSRLWSVYAATLTLVGAAFPLLRLPNLSYLLDEDRDTAAFIAFDEKTRARRLQDSAGLAKPTRSEADTVDVQPPSKEMLVRIKDLVKDGVYICRHADEFGSASAPLAFGEARFVYTGVFAESSSGHSAEGSGGSMESAVIHHAAHIANGTSDTAAPLRTGRSTADTMEDLVDELVGSEPDPAQRLGQNGPAHLVMNGSPSGSRPSSGYLTAHGLVRQKQQSPLAIPIAISPLISHHSVSLPGILNSPFTPRPGETNSFSPRPSTSHLANGSTTPPNFPQTPASSGTAFDHQIAQRQQAIKNRSSSMQSFDPTITPSSYYETPTGFDTFVREKMSRPTSSSPWVSYTNTSSAPAMEVPRQVAQASPFGAIGDPRPKTAKTPTSFQPA